MTTDEGEFLHKVLWPDAILEHVAADYDAVVLRVRESTGRVRTIRCEGYVGYGVCGFWDEVVIERALVSTSHPFIERCTTSISGRLGDDWPESGNEARNTRKWKALVIHLLDGASLEVVAAKFTVD